MRNFALDTNTKNKEDLFEDYIDENGNQILWFSFYELIDSGIIEIGFTEI